MCKRRWGRRVGVEGVIGWDEIDDGCWWLGYHERIEVRPEVGIFFLLVFILSFLYKAMVLLRACRVIALDSWM